MAHDGYDLVYSYGGRVAHLRRYGELPYGVECGGFPSVWSAVLGTGSQDEYDRAEAMPLCKNCAKSLTARVSAPNLETNGGGHLAGT